jgi:hypothetical protein
MYDSIIKEIDGEEDAHVFLCSSRSIHPRATASHSFLSRGDLLSLSLSHYNVGSGIRPIETVCTYFWSVITVPVDHWGRWLNLEGA